MKEQHTLTPETHIILKRLLDRLLTLSPTGTIGDGLVATLKHEADLVQKSLNMNLRPALGPSRYKDVNGGDFFMIHLATSRSLMHQDGEDEQWLGLTDTTGTPLTRPRPRSLTTGSFVRLSPDAIVEPMTKQEALKLVEAELVSVVSYFKARLLDKN